MKDYYSHRCSVADEETLTSFENEVELPIAQGRDEIIGAYVADLRSDDPRHIYGEAPLGCARGVLWAFGLEAVVVIAIAMCLYLLHT